MSSSAIALLDRAVAALAEARTIPEVKELLDIAAAAQEYARRVKLSQDVIDHATEIRIRAERRLGELLRETYRARGGGDKRSPDHLSLPSTGDPSGAPTLADLGVSRDLSSRAQRLAGLDDEEFEERIVAGKAEGTLSIRSVSRPHVTHNSGENEWYTPAGIIEAARAVMGGIDLDPASSAAANEVVRAARFYTATDNGLIQPWEGRIWLNPPYSGILVARFVEKLVAEHRSSHVGAAVMLTNNATETVWGQSLLGACSAVCFPSGRIRFGLRGEEKATPLQGQMICYLGPRVEIFTDVFSALGVCRA